MGILLQQISKHLNLALSAHQGEASQYGSAVKNAMKMAINDYNKKHGTKITGVYYDDKADPTTAVNDYNKLYNDDGVSLQFFHQQLGLHFP